MCSRERESHTTLHGERERKSVCVCVGCERNKFRMSWVPRHNYLTGNKEQDLEREREMCARARVKERARERKREKSKCE